MTAPSSTFELQVADHRDYLLRFARLQLRNDAWAEDCVSETMLAALAKPQAFGNRSQLKTWLVGILKHKVLDTLRSRSREAVLDGEGGILRGERLAAQGPVRGIELAEDQFHTLVALEPDTVMFELKQGPYIPTTDKDFLSAFPVEGSPEAAVQERRWRQWFEG